MLGTGTEIEPEDLPDEVAAAGARAEASAGGDYQDSMRAYKRHLVEETLRQTDGNQTRAAERLGLQRTYLSKLMKDLGLR